MLSRFEAAANAQEISPHRYRNLVRDLNTKQRQIIMHHRRWCKTNINNLRQGLLPSPFYTFLSGPGGVGKSHVIEIMHSDTIKLLRLSGSIQPDDVTVLLTAPTGVAAFNINGITLHSALLLGCGRHGGFQPLSSERLNTLRIKLSTLLLLIIDEVSMVGSSMLYNIHKRLQQIKGTPPDVLFGGVSILAVGDLHQLSPVGQPPIFNIVGDSYASLYRSGSLWKDEFQLLELDEVMRQRGDRTFIDLLCHVRLNQCTAEDIELLQSRVITEADPDYPTHVLHVYTYNVDVDGRNERMLNMCAQQEDQFSITAKDTITGQTRHVNLSNISNKRSDTGGLHTTLKIAIGARVMLTTNIDVSDGLVNGATGEVVHIVVTADENVHHILVKFDNLNVGLQKIQSSPYKSLYNDAVPISKHETTFLAQGKRGSEITRLQFPLTLAWATTIHKVQGLTLPKIVVNFKGRFNPGQAYVAISRVKSLNDLYIVNFNASAIKHSEKVEEEMSRLQNKLLPPLPLLQCQLLQSSQHLTISLLNIRSIRNKIQDITSDSCLALASIVCFTETWLFDQDDSPQLFDNHVILRCDRTSDNHCGGVLISLINTITVCSVRKIASNGIECLIAQLLLLNNHQVYIILLYRSPTSPISSLVNIISQILLLNIHVSVPTFILGDFNVDYLHQPQSQLSNVLNAHSFIQLVQSATTDQGSLLDHVYLNTNTENILTEVHDTYYSDHDTVYITIPH